MIEVFKDLERKIQNILIMRSIEKISLKNMSRGLFEQSLRKAQIQEWLQLKCLDKAEEVLLNVG